MQWEAPNHGVDFLKTVVPVDVLFTVGVGLAKGSVLLLYKRIFSLDRRMSRWVNVVAAIVSDMQKSLSLPACCISDIADILPLQIAAWYVTIILIAVLQCRPLAVLWNHSIKGECLDFRKLSLASAIGHTITTLIVVSLPQPWIWTLNMSWGKKIAYSGMCFLGIV